MAEGEDHVIEGPPAAEVAPVPATPAPVPPESPRAPRRAPPPRDDDSESDSDSDGAAWRHRSAANCYMMLGAALVVLLALVSPWLPLWGDDPTAEAPVLGEWSLMAHGLAVVHCHHANTSAALAWRRADDAFRKRTGDTATRKALRKTEELRQRLCLFPADAAGERAGLHHVNHTFLPYVEAAVDGRVARALDALTTQELARMEPYVRAAVVDYSGRVYVRVVRVAGEEGGRLEAVLLDLEDLMDALEHWRRTLLRRLEGVGLTEPPCICPGHFGIVASGLHFIVHTSAYAKRPLGPGRVWRVLADFVPELLVRAVQTRSTLPMLEALADFPARVDRALMPHNRTVEHPSSVYFTGHDLWALGERATAESYDDNLRFEWQRRDAVAGTGGALAHRRAGAGADDFEDEDDDDEEDDGDARRHWAFGSDDERVAQRKRDERRRLAAVLALSLTAPHTAVGELGAPSIVRCYYHCRQLDETLINMTAGAQGEAEAPTGDHKPGDVPYLPPIDMTRDNADVIDQRKARRDELKRMRDRRQP